MNATTPSVRIGVFDSGVGGLSVLQALHALLPTASLDYVADSGHAPYGERDPAFVLDRSRRIARFLQRHGARLIVIACNTATAAAAHALRQTLSHVPIVGIEPGIKPAAALTTNGRIGVMATHGTLASGKFRALLQQVAASAPPQRPLHFELQACAGLAQAIERHAPESEEVAACIATHAAPLRAAGCDVVVLGCTHYPLVAGQIQQALDPGVRLLDTSQAVARRTASLIDAMPGRSSDPGGPALRLWSTGETAVLERLAARSFGRPVSVGRVAI